MTINPNDLSQEMYHRLYRLIKRNVDPRFIAATLNLPLRTVLTVVSRLENPDKTVEGQMPVETRIQEKKATGSEKGFLDVYCYPKTRFAIVNVVGTLVEEFTNLLDKELEKSLAFTWKAVAIKMTDVISIDKHAAKSVLAFQQKFQNHNKFLAILDPSVTIEPLLLKYELEGKVPIFGTERAFEDAAFAKKPFRKTSRTH